MGLISGLGLLAAGLAWMGRRRRKGVAADASPIADIDSLPAKEEPMLERPYCGADGDRIVNEIAAELIDDEQLRRRWVEFDQHFLRHCIEGGDHGIVFSPKGFAGLEEVDPQLLQIGVRVYNKASQEATRRRHTCYRALNILAMAYLSATRTAR